MRSTLRGSALGVPVVLAGIGLLLLFVGPSAQSQSPSQPPPMSSESPAVRFLLPQEGEVLRERAEIVVEASGFVDLKLVSSAYFEYSADGERWGLIAQVPAGQDGRFSAEWDTRRVPDGRYLLRATVLGLGDQRASATTEVVVDNARALPFFLVPRDASLEEALAQAPPGATVRLDARQGPFTGSFTIRQEGLLLESVHGYAELDGRGADVVLAVEADGVVIRGLQITGGRTGVLVRGDDVRLEGNEFLGASPQEARARLPLEEVELLTAVRVRDAQGVTLANNAFRGILETGISLEAAEGARIEGNAFDEGCFQAVEGFLTRGVEVLENEIACTYGIAFVEGEERFRIEGNRLDVEAIGIRIQSREVLIANNEVRSAGVGISLWDSARVEVRGNRITSRGTEGAVGLETVGGEALIRGNEIRGFRIGLDFPFFDRVEIRENLIAENIVGIQVSTFVLLVGTPFTLQITRNNIVDNSEFGLRVEEEQFRGGFRPPLRRVDARENWWGDPSGPFHPEQNPEGRGDRVSNLVSFKPWLTEPVALEPQS